jgi:DNA invertase Pin-like site-specific DNA recombinase
MLFGYARVSKGDEQSTAVQTRALKGAGCDRLFEEAASGGRWDRPQLHRMLDQLRPDDIVVVWKLDRLSRSLKDLLHILEKLEAAGAGAPDDDADGRQLRRVRTRHDPRADQRC